MGGRRVLLRTRGGLPPIRPSAHAIIPRLHLDDFLDEICAERPETIDALRLAEVHPHPWFTRHGSGTKARLVMGLRREVWYHRQQGETVWQRIDDGSEFEALRFAA